MLLQIHNQNHRGNILIDFCGSVFHNRESFDDCWLTGNMLRQNITINVRQLHVLGFFICMTDIYTLRYRAYFRSPTYIQTEKTSSLKPATRIFEPVLSSVGFAATENFGSTVEGFQVYIFPCTVWLVLLRWTACCIALCFCACNNTVAPSFQQKIIFETSWWTNFVAAISHKHTVCILVHSI